MALPLPRVVADVEAGGPFVTASKGLNALQELMLMNQAKKIENQFMPDKLRMANEHQGLVNKWYEPNIQSEIGHRNALTNEVNTLLPGRVTELNQKNQMYIPNMLSEMGLRRAHTNQLNTITPLEANRLQIENQFRPESERAKINALLATANFKNMGGAGGGVGAKEDMYYKNLVSQDNPQLRNDPNRVREAADVLAAGGNQLSDGTPLNPLSFSSQKSLQRLNKGATTSALLTQNVKANQAEAELDVLGKFAKQGLKPYATTIMGKSPSQIIDSFKTDDASQTRLGKFVASQALQYEIAQIRNRLAGGEPGISATMELMEKSGQIIDTHFPKLSGKAREVAQDTIDEALKEGLKARNKVGMFGSNEEPSKGAKALSKDIDVPSFTSKEEFNSWFASQPSVVQSAIQLKLARK